MVGEENKTHTRRERICCEKRCANTTLVMSKPMPGLRRMQYIFYGHDQWIWPAEEGRMSTRASALCPRIRNPGPIPTGPEPHNSSTAYAKLPSRTSDMGQRRVSSRAKRPHAAALTLALKNEMARRSSWFLVSGRLVPTHKQTHPSHEISPPRRQKAPIEGPIHVPFGHIISSVANSLLVVHSKAAVSSCLRIL